MEEFGSKTYYLSFSSNKEAVINCNFNLGYSQATTPGMTPGNTPNGMTPGFANESPVDDCNYAVQSLISWH